MHILSENDVFPHDSGHYARDRHAHDHSRMHILRENDVFPHDSGHYARDRHAHDHSRRYILRENDDVPRGSGCHAHDRIHRNIPCEYVSDLRAVAHNLRGNARIRNAHHDDVPAQHWSLKIYCFLVLFYDLS